MSRIVPLKGKYYDFGTKNTSFLKTAQELKTLGIENWYFMLEVKNVHLNVQDIDPHDPNLTPDQMGRVHKENKENLWYFLRECSRIPAKGATKPYTLELTRASVAAIWCYDHSIDFLLDQPRQTHKTTIITLLTTYSIIYGYKNIEIPYMHLEIKRVRDNAETLRDYILSLPSYMNPWDGKKPPGLESIAYKEHNVSVKLLASSDSEVKAGDKLRGFTLYTGFIDEWEFVNYIDHVLMGGSPAMASARAISKDSGVRTCMMYASTPGNLETNAGKAAQRIIDQTPPFSEKMYDLTPDELLQMFAGDPETNRKPPMMVYIKFNYIQLRKDEKWLREQYAYFDRLGKYAEYKRGVLQLRFRGDNSVLFEQKDIDYLTEHVKTPDYEMLITKDKFLMYVYKHHISVPDLNSRTPWFDMSVPYMIGIDVATGSDGDNTAIIIVHPYTLEIVAELQSPWMGTTALMRVITYLASMLPLAVFCLETNNIGKAIVDFVQESQLEHRFYHDPELDLAKNVTKIKQPYINTLQQRAKEKGYIGVYVTSKVRNDMFDLLKRHVKEFKHLLISHYLVKDIFNLVVHKNGKIAAEDGEHDDMVMAYLHVLYILYYGSNLERFNIHKEKCQYEKAYDIIADYEKNIEENVVDNMIPYDTPALYENQLLEELMKQRGDDDVDEYGYRRSAYYGSTQHVMKNNDINSNDTLTAADMAFFAEVNDF